ncbi:hypothetical protein AVEN_29439-1 [Araneus ventricosus]|uniref:Uncharacterized protein n=1 Tax=Araneus ventricosus TaxID=182803 RepID=A0A4Y2CYR1_ARAVE|nr:hypothetical protein AVEN_29439-1 [Araneus ventricosus]
MSSQLTLVAARVQIKVMSGCSRVQPSPESSNRRCGSRPSDKSNRYLTLWKSLSRCPHPLGTYIVGNGTGGKLYLSDFGICLVLK